MVFSHTTSCHIICMVWVVLSKTPQNGLRVFNQSLSRSLTISSKAQALRSFVPIIKAITSMLYDFNKEHARWSDTGHTQYKRNLSMFSITPLVYGLISFSLSLCQGRLTFHLPWLTFQWLRKYLQMTSPGWSSKIQKWNDESKKKKRGANLCGHTRGPALS